jgi:hypothetical protein
MLFSSSLTTTEVLAVFAESVTAHGGRVTDTFDDGRRLFTRSVLPHVEEVRPRDQVQGGVALKATAEGVWLYPYVFRLVCRNGAIMAETLEARSVGHLPPQEPDVALQSIREGVEACCAREVFVGTVHKMRATCATVADLALTLLPLLTRLSRAASPSLLSQIMDRFFGETDRSPFGLANVITSIARDTQDPNMRWDLEELGGGIAIATPPEHPVGRGGAVLPRAGRMVSVS